MTKYLLANTVERKTEGVERRTSKLYKHDIGQQKGLRIMIVQKKILSVLVKK